MERIIAQKHNAETANGWLMPCVDSYQEQKQVRIVGHRLHDPGASNTTCLGFGNCSLQNTSRSQKWLAFYEMRLQAALSGETPSTSFFPGDTIPGPGGGSCQDIYRGSLMSSQFFNLFDFTAGTPETQRLGQFTQPPRYAAQKTELWPWAHAERPDNLVFVDMQTLGEEILQSAASSRQTKSNEQIQSNAQNQKHIYKKQLEDTCLTLLADYKNNLPDILLTIHTAWSDAPAVCYSQESLEEANRALATLMPKLNRDNLLDVLFELEALSSYSTYVGKSNIFASGMFAGNWLEVSLAPLRSIRATEFCVRERLFDELLNLTSQRYAPIVINEFGSVSDGNHRLTASWLWNLLKFTSDCNWSLEDTYFQQKIGRFISEFQPGPISTHEILGHLAFFLSNPECRSRLKNQVKRLISRHGFISEVPVVLLPEYSSSTVIKDKYDAGLGIVRLAPSLYHALQVDPSLVLPPRASYHFTDSALLPWFSVLTSATNKHHIFHKLDHAHRHRRKMPDMQNT